MREWAIGIILLYLLQACTNVNTSKKGDHESTRRVRSLDDLIAHQTDTAALIRSIEGSPCVESEYIGFVGRKSYVYASFQRLDQLISDTAWLKLSYNSKAVMKAYAYWALMKRKSALLPVIRDHLKNDTATICFISADVTSSWAIGYFISDLK